MYRFRVAGIPEEISRKVRETLTAPGYGHPAHVSVANGYGPCRACLRTFEIGQEDRILFTYNPFAALDPYPSPGPVFIHQDGCERYDGTVFPDSLRPLPLTLEAYGRDRWIHHRERVADGQVEEALERLLAHPEVEYVHVRNTEAGCFIALVERTVEE
jgi:hypothetical protein